MKNITKILALAMLGAAAGLATPALAGPQDNSVNVGMQLEPPNLDPTDGAAAAIDEVTYANVFEGLTRFAEDGSIVPDLAKSWDISKDGLTYTFHLHSGVTFQDGTKMTADDVKFSLDRATAPDSTNAQKALFADIKDVSVVDPLTVKVTLKKPNGVVPLQHGLGRRRDRLAEDRQGQRHPSGRHRPVHVQGVGQGRPRHAGQLSGLLGRQAEDRQGDVQVHLRSDRGLCRDDVGRPRLLPEFPRAGEPGPVQGRPALQGGRRLHRGRDHPRHEQRQEALRQHQGARGGRPRDRPQGGDRRRDVRLRHADRHAFRAAAARPMST